MAFPGGESVEDLTRRSEKAVRDVVLPHVVNVARSERDEHIALVGHGLCIAHLVSAIVRLGGGTWKRKGPMVNTAWVRIEVRIQVSVSGIYDEVLSMDGLGRNACGSRGRRGSTGRSDCNGRGQGGSP